MEKRDVVLYEIKECVAIITINRPDALNALNRDVNVKLVQLLDDAEKDEQAKVIVLTGSGTKAFVAGGDINEMANLDAIGARNYALQAKRAVDALYTCSKPVIAAINGLCLGGGLEYAMACDFRVASENAKFGQPEINIGIMPGSGGTQRLPRYIGMGKAKELIFTGAMVTASEALSLGLVNHVFSKESFMEEIMSIATTIAGKSAVALSLIKTAMDRGAQVDIESGSLLEIDCFGLCFATDEQKKGMDKFINKKKG
ncbi:MAG TPA: crotonase [Deltaproteobacteria bacterium]|nr:crotonase [Deltaproteobacteria bacterium]